MLRKLLAAQVHLLFITQDLHSQTPSIGNELVPIETSSDDPGLSGKYQSGIYRVGNPGKYGPENTISLFHGFF